MKIENIIDKDGKTTMRDARRDAPEYRPYQGQIGHVYRDVKTNETLCLGPGESRSVKFLGRKLRFIGSAAIYPRGWDGDPARFRLIGDMSAAKVLPPLMNAES